MTDRYAQRDDAIAKIDRAAQIVADLCDGKIKWTLSVPARLDSDPDLVIADALRAARVALSAEPVPQDVRDAEKYLSDLDFAALIRFNACCEDFDAGGHDVPKERMKRLEQLGVVRSLGFGKHETTAFGDYLIEATFLQNPNLPLKTIDEHNAIAAQDAGKGEAK